MKKVIASSVVVGVERESSLLNSMYFFSTNNLLYIESPKKIIKEDRKTATIAITNLSAVALISGVIAVYPGSAVNRITTTGINIFIIIVLFNNCFIFLFPTSFFSSCFCFSCSFSFCFFYCCFNIFFFCYR